MSRFTPLHVTRASDVEPTQLPMLWRDRIPANTLKPIDLGEEAVAHGHR